MEFKVDETKAGGDTEDAPEAKELKKSTSETALANPQLVDFNAGFPDLSSGDELSELAELYGGE